MPSVMDSKLSPSVKHKGKRSEGLLSLSATTAGEMIVIKIADDGRGIDRQSRTRIGQEPVASVKAMLISMTTLYSI